MLPKDELIIIIGRATDAFWGAVAASCPEAQHGDLDPLETHLFDEAVERAVKAWVLTNVPQPCAIDEHDWSAPCQCEEPGHLECAECGAVRCHDCDAITIDVSLWKFGTWQHQDPAVPPCFLSDTVPA